MEQQDLFNRLVERFERDLNILPDKSEENAQNTLRALWLTASGNPISPVAAADLPLPALSSAQLAELHSWVETRLSGVPLAHLTGRQDFMGLDYIINKGLYIPRKETELLAKTALACIAEHFTASPEIKVIDVCTGIGTVALAIAHYCRKAVVFGSDIYAPAIEAALVNARHFGLEERSTFFNADLFDPFEACSLRNEVHIIVSAPPYISTEKVKHLAPEIAQHEPEEAFNAGPFGFSVFMKLISTAPEYLLIDGYLIIECGLGQGPFLAKRLAANGHYGDVIEVPDALGNVRVLMARRVL